MILMLWLAGNSNTLEVRLGDPDFRGINADALAKEITENGPVLFPDLVGGERTIWVTHTSTDPLDGWSAFLAKIPGKEANCVAHWEANTFTFIDSCDPMTSFPADGAGLEQLAWEIVDKELRISINNYEEVEK